MADHVPATGHQRADAVADLETGRRHRLRVARDDCAGYFQTRNVRRAGRHRIVAGALKHVRTIHAGSGNTDQHFTASRLRIRSLAQLQHIGRTKGSYFNDFHAFS